MWGSLTFRPVLALSRYTFNWPEIDIGKLTAKQVKNALKVPGSYQDRDSLSLKADSALYCALV